VASRKAKQDASGAQDVAAQATAPEGVSQAQGEPLAKKRKETRNADGDGSLYFDKARKLWIGEVMVGWKPDAKNPLARVRDRRKVSAKTQSECRTKLQQLRQEITGGTLSNQSKGDTVAAYLARWLKAKEGTVRVRTHDRYRQFVNTHLVPAFGTVKLTALKPDALQRLYGEKLAAGLSPRTVRHLHTVFHTALEQAVRWGHVPRNIADVVTPPVVPHVELRPLGADEVGRLLTVAEQHDDRLRALWEVAAHTGCRQGELLALTWNDVDLDGAEIRIRRILLKVKDFAGTFGETKTARSRRVVPLTEDAIEALKAHKDRQAFERKHLGEDYGTSNLVFCTHMGTPLNRGVVQGQFKRALDRAKLPMVTRFHDLRHTAATLMLAGGVDIPTAAAILGHSQNSTTLNVYAHAMPSRLKGGTAAIQRALRGA